MPDALLDSTVLIDSLRGQADVATRLAALVEDKWHLCACAVTVAEVFAGMREGERDATERLLLSLDWYDIGHNIAQEAGELYASLRRAGRTVSITDLLIGCTARSNQAVLLTANTKDFLIPGLTVERLPSAR